MSIIYPANRQEIADRGNADIKAALPDSDPTLRNAFLYALATAYYGALYDAYKTIQDLQKQLLPDTATGEFADRWAAFKGIYRKAANGSTGNITITGTAGITVPAGVQLQSSNGVSFVTHDSASIQLQTINVQSLTRSGNVVTATTVSNHFFATGNYINISGTDQIAYNGRHKIVVTGDNTFTYDIVETPTTPATGTIYATATFSNVRVDSIDFGLKTNFANGSELFFSSAIAGVDTSAVVQYEGLTGGSDLESDDDFRKRYLYVYQHPVAFFNVAQITQICEAVSGVTRVFVQEITPDVGQVTVYFTCDNDSNPIPSGAKVQSVKDELLKIKPAHVDPNDVIVSAPTPKPINFKFSVLDPNTDTMKAAIKASLQAFFSEVPIVGQNLSKNSYASAIYYTVDPSTGNFVNNFVLAYPLGDILVAENELAIFGGIDP